jgi:drug/metabolite transporter (DMT)-like permease
MRKWWVAFWVLSIIWGSSFLLIRIAVEQMPPAELVFFRNAIAAIGLNLVLLYQRKPLPYTRTTLSSVVIMGLTGIALPCLLISWGEQSIDSGVTAVLQASVALFTLVMAHFAFVDERITGYKIVGLLVGFVGVIILASRSWIDGQIEPSSLYGQLAVIAASALFAFGSNYSRKTTQGTIEPLVLATGAITTAAVVMGLVNLLAMMSGQTLVNPFDLETSAVVAVIMLGIFNTFAAWVLFYSIIKYLGATRASMVAYVVVPIGLVLGVLVRDEVVDERVIIGGLLIIGAVIYMDIKSAYRHHIA